MKWKRIAQESYTKCTKGHNNFPIFVKNTQERHNECTKIAQKNTKEKQKSNGENTDIVWI